MAQKHPGSEEALSAMKQIGSTKTVKRIRMLLMEILFFLKISNHIDQIDCDCVLAITNFQINQAVNIETVDL